MVIRIKRKLYFKPRFCPGCGKTCLFCRHYLSLNCKECHHRKRVIAKRARHRRHNREKYTKSYFRMRRRLIREHPYCALCQSETRLTVHHVGGGCEHYTVLCDECHQAYERWNNKRKAKQWKKNILIAGSRSWRNITRAAQFHFLMYCYRTQTCRRLERREARLAFASSAKENITN